MTSKFEGLPDGVYLGHDEGQGQGPGHGHGSSGHALGLALAMANAPAVPAINFVTASGPQRTEWSTPIYPSYAGKIDGYILRTSSFSDSSASLDIAYHHIYIYVPAMLIRVRVF